MPNLHKSNQLLVLLSLFFCAFSAYSQEEVLWENSYGGTNAEYLLDAIPTPDNGFIMAGSSISGASGNLTQASKGDLDYWVHKINQNGEILWQKSFGGSGLDLLQSVQLTPDLGIILGGVSSSDINFDKTESCKGNTDFWIIKLDANGNEQWQKTIGGSGQEKLKTIVTTTDGGYIIGGSSSSNISLINESNEIDPNGKSENSRGNIDYWVVKLSASGVIEWQKTLGGKYVDELKSIVPIAGGGYVLGGYSNSPESGDKTENNIGIGDYWIVKLNSIGNIIWQKTIGGDLDDDLFALVQTQDGGFALGGNSNSSSSNAKNRGNASGTDYWIVKLDTEGVISWQETYNFGQNDVVNSIVENPDGSLLLGGYAQTEADSSTTGEGVNKLIGNLGGDKEGINDYIALKINSSGETIWSKSVGSKGDEVMKKMLPTHDGGYLLAGTSNGGKSRDKDSEIGGSDFWVVKLKNKIKPEKIAPIIGAHPNPTVNTTTVGVNYNYDYGTATLNDLNGRQLQSVELKGEKQIPFNLVSLPQGLYLVNVKTNNGTNAVKIIKK